AAIPGARAVQWRPLSLPPAQRGCRARDATHRDLQNAPWAPLHGRSPPALFPRSRRCADRHDCGRTSACPGTRWEPTSTVLIRCLVPYRHQVVHRRSGKWEQTLTGAQAHRPCEALHTAPQGADLCGAYTWGLGPMQSQGVVHQFKHVVVWVMDVGVVGTVVGTGTRFGIAHTYGVKVGQHALPIGNLQGEMVRGDRLGLRGLGEVNLSGTQIELKLALVGHRSTVYELHAEDSLIPLLSPLTVANLDV